MQDCVVLDPAVLQPISTLQHLVVTDIHGWENADPAEALLTWVGKQQQGLTRLHCVMKRPVWGPDVGQLVRCCPQLRDLSISARPGAAGQQAVIPAGKCARDLLLLTLHICDPPVHEHAMTAVHITTTSRPSTCVGMCACASNTLCSTYVCLCGCTESCVDGVLSCRPPAAAAAPHFIGPVSHS
jgi:hypothetical protein